MHELCALSLEYILCSCMTSLYVLSVQCIIVVWMYAYNIVRWIADLIQLVAHAMHKEYF